ncbi:MAG: CapA family protein [Mesorhizobium sp.]|uniref:CapA family protein n=1 Tax=Mesorhizobium TaxID=68287 RepID=UPI000FD3597E|nr:MULTISPECIES: CapA family protein [Mesorhizobium]MCF6115219.1 CapA family protein [Mesorhizobium muleiense]RVD19595.1 CapA family protein [Mesorhizobium sp. M7A.F.Ca.ET.027.02.1.1]RWD12470.1 MAG: CapA family protein [Mesorhizobium sp.]RWD49703.1 MAG: CapA family protein [Mesorhizobium sp.]RWE11467.1 MAG: CapA family protein [Mesorhizobium sp.]
MTIRLPIDPIEVFQPNEQALEAIRRAEVRGSWEFPLHQVANGTPEGTGNGLEYWFYTSRYPITKTSREVSDALSSLKAGDISLPTGWVEETAVSLAACGDLIQAADLEASNNQLFSQIKDVVFDKDVSFANYESVVADAHKVNEVMPDITSFRMCCTIEQYRTLTSHNTARFDVLNMANNHANDLGVDELTRTQDIAESDGILTIGAPRNKAEYGKCKTLTKNGIKIGFVSATYSLNGFALPPGHEFRIHVSRLMSRHVPTELDLLRAQIADCKEQDCDFIIASIHWGVEFEFFPLLGQIEAAHALVEEGVDLILGTHPHVIQPVEYYRPKGDPHRTAIIAYSLGSLTWDWFTAPHLILSLVLNLNISKGRTIAGEQRTYLKSAQPIPIIRNISLDKGKRTMQLEKLGDRLDEIGNATGGDLIKMKDYCDLVLGQGWARSSVVPE